ncbi:hypothetical protein [uncultured Nisaea sp.]|uniref:hypothetical protein n=1 Tax=uncultured Nisaea sp. TaxID=538215 RepID=UPI0030EC7CB7|tara:strand:- start:1269 stop:1694 length:426 start_codon:yes stop_codon:yes gene_type:complete
MQRARLTTSELRNPAGHSHARRRMIAAVFGVLALLTQAGFTLGASAALTSAPPGSLAADLAKLCLGAIDGPDGGWDDGSPSGSAASCGHCNLCGVAGASVLPATEPETAGRIAASLRLRSLTYQVHSQGFTRFRNPRAPPL